MDYEALETATKHMDNALNRLADVEASAHGGQRTTVRTMREALLAVRMTAEYGTTGNHRVSSAYALRKLADRIAL